jgi:predicted ATPase/class 3 adenylate cyclase
MSFEPRKHGLIVVQRQQACPGFFHPHHITRTQPGLAQQLTDLGRRQRIDDVVDPLEIDAALGQKREQVPARRAGRLLVDRKLRRGVADVPSLGALPSGLVTLLFTDIEGSTRLLSELGTERYAAALLDHRERLRVVAAAHRGTEFGTEGDALFFVFPDARDGVVCAGEMQAAIAGGPLRVRIGVHSGEVLLADGDYVGMAVHKVARICSAAHGGQVVVSDQARALAGVALRDLGEHRLKDLTAPEPLFQFGDRDFPPLRTLRHANLPVQATALIGRERELAELLELAGAHRVVTLTGTGGTGKTRLALALAAELADSYADGVCWVPLASVSDPSLVLAEIATALGGIEDLRAYLSGRALLLVLDNVEQVIESAQQISDLLLGAQRCAAIVTSRERLAISGEQEYPLGPLSRHDAALLFTTRAREVNPAFEPGETIDAICERLDRLPLALELAAPRVKLLSEHELLNRLEQRLPLLAGGRRDLPVRQSTMRAAIAWSYELLSEGEQRLFTNLAVFHGSFGLEAAERICDADIDTLQSLIEKSLLRHADNGRHSLLETTREFALEQFVVSDQCEEIRARHARWYFELGVAARDHDPGRPEALIRLREESADVATALSWALDHDIAAALPLADSLFSERLAVGRIGELSQWYERALADPDALAPGDRADALAGLGMTLEFEQNLGPARTALTEALALYEQAGNERGRIRVLNDLGGIEWVGGFSERAIDWHEQALEGSERLDDPKELVRSLNYLADAVRDVGEYDRATQLYIRAIEICRSRGPRTLRSLLHSLGDLLLDKGDSDEAARYYRESLALGIEEENTRHCGYCLAGLACVAAHNQDAASAGRLWTLAERIEHELGHRMLAAERGRYERTITPALRESDGFRAGAAAAADLDPLTAADEILRR